MVICPVLIDIRGSFAFRFHFTTSSCGSSRWIGSDVLLISTPDDGDAAAIAATLGRQPEIEWAQPNYIRKRKLRPNDPAYNLQWNLNLINLPGAWDINHGSSATVTVALVDSGVNTSATSPTFRVWTGQAFENVTIPFAVNPDRGLRKLAEEQGWPILSFTRSVPLRTRLGLDDRAAAVAVAAVAAIALAFVVVALTHRRRRPERL